MTLPRRGLLSGTADLATRCKISHRKALAITAKLVKMGGGQLDQCSLSASTSLRQRTSAVVESESRIKAEFASSMPSNIVLHWDGKVIKYENRKESDELLAIVLSSPQLEHHTQFLAAPQIPDGTGASMKDALMTTLNVWDIPANNIIGMCWDTTASNTGRNQGSATLFEQELGRGIMWLVCRHHIGELHIKHADVEVRGAWAGPTDRLFEQFRERFPNIQIDPVQLRLWNWPEVSRPHTFLVARALDVRHFLQQHLLEDDFGRDDYRELCELIIKYLGGQVIRSRRRPGALGDDFVMRAPGALHHARFLASCLYIMKLVMLSNLTPRGLLTPNMLANLERMAQYIALFHGSWFLQARVVAIAPRLDFNLWEQMGSYQDIDAPIARAVRQSLLRHLWYLTEHLVILAFFDESVAPEVKEDMATRLHNTPRPQNFATGKPEFPTGIITANIPTMEQFIGPKSWLLFHLLGNNGAWLTMPPDQWSTNQEYNNMRDIVTKLEVVNDVAERGVKDIQDYADAARDGAYRERIILVSNSHRIKLPGFSKNEMDEYL